MFVATEVYFQAVNLPSRRKNYYGILGVKQDATTQEIKAAFVAKSNQLHPDRRFSEEGDDTRVGWSRQSGTERFMLVKEAYDCLRNVERRKEYDDQILLTGGGGFLMEATTSRFKESSIVDLNKQRNESYVGPSSRQSTHTNHFRDPEQEYYDEKRKNRFLVLIGGVVAALIMANVAYVWFLRRQPRQRLPVSATSNND